MKNFPFRATSAFLLALSLTGCGGMMAYREATQLSAEGRNSEAIAKLEEAVRLEPKNAEYRIALSSRRAALTTRALSSAESFRRDGRWAEATDAYQQALSNDPQNPMARQGLESIAAERRYAVLVAEADQLFKKGRPEDYSLALDKLRGVLQANPNHREANSLREQIETARAKYLRPEARLAAIYRKPISLEFRDAPLRSVFDVIARVSGLNFFFDKDLRADTKATIFARNTSIEDAIRLLTVTNQLEQSVLSENSILIYPSTPQKIKDYQTLTMRTFYLTNADVKAVSNTIKTIVKTKDIVVDERLGLIIMRDTPQAIRVAERIVALQDLTDPEVMLEVEVMEIKRSRLMELGINWPAQVTLSPLAANGTAVTLADLRNLSSATTQVTGANFIINARKEDQDGNILANPRIRVRNKEKAKILIGDRVPIITTTSVATGFVSESVTYVDVGLKLEVEPTIYLDEEVAIKINLEVSNLVREIISKSGSLSYQIGTRGANTVLRLKDGETQILAGLINDEDRTTANKVPGVGELPVVGRLFGSQKDDTQRSEILLSITPRVIRSVRRPDLLAAEFESGTESRIGVESLSLSQLEAAVNPARAAAPTPTGPISVAASVPSQVQTPGPPLPTQVAAPSTVAIKLDGPSTVKVGDQFTATVSVSAAQGVSALPLVVVFDPAIFQAVSVAPGNLFDGATTPSFNQQIDQGQGRIFIATNAGSGATQDAGRVASISFRAVAPSDKARVAIQSVAPQPAGFGVGSLPEMSIAVSK